MAVDPIYLMIGIVSAASFILLCLNLYIIWKRSKNKQPNQEQLILHQRLDSLSQLVSDQLKESRESTQKATLAVHQQVQGFTQGMTQLQEGLKNMHESVKNVSSFQDLFRNPKLRGQWGEMSLEASLAQYFPRDRYAIQHYF